jgi:VIT1/CCC1 family predicted Fe2+/Mn2+ transporter
MHSKPYWHASSSVAAAALHRRHAPAAVIKILAYTCCCQHCRAPWLRAFVLGANDGLVSVASLILGVGAGSDSLKAMQLSGMAGLVAGALSMACGEYISVSSQRDTELADIEKERQEQLKGPEARAKELEELTGIYMERGLSRELARQVAEELTEKDVIRAVSRQLAGPSQQQLSVGHMSGYCMHLEVAVQQLPPPPCSSSTSSAALLGMLAGPGNSPCHTNSLPGVCILLRLTRNCFLHLPLLSAIPPCVAARP